MPVFLTIGLSCLLLGFVLLWKARHLQRQTGLPAGPVVYSDTSDWKRCERPLFSKQFRLSGKPDYIVRRRGELTPVELKSSRGLAQPYESHVLQLMAYCLLVEEHEARRPVHGLLRYPDRTFSVPYTPVARSQLLEVVARLRADLRSDDVPRSHSDPRRCRNCGFRRTCSQSL